MSDTNEIEQFSKTLTKELTTRRREIIALHSKSTEGADPHFGRAILILTYSHFEGYVGSSTRQLLAVLAEKRLMSRKLKPGIIALFSWTRLREFAEQTSVPSVSFIKELTSIYDQDHRFRAPKAVDLQSNLSSEVLTRLVRCLHVPEDFYINNVEFIDKLLLKPRNAIAHGELVDITASAAKERFERTFTILTQFQTDLENLLVTTGYLV